MKGKLLDEGVVGMIVVSIPFPFLRALADLPLVQVLQLHRCCLHILLD